jgi:hypothetical protein
MACFRSFSLLLIPFGEFGLSLIHASCPAPLRMVCHALSYKIETILYVTKTNVENSYSLRDSSQKCLLIDDCCTPSILENYFSYNLINFDHFTISYYISYLLKHVTLLFLSLKMWEKTKTKILKMEGSIT